jgi:hypothetical protein
MSRNFALAAFLFLLLTLTLTTPLLITTLSITTTSSRFHLFHIFGQSEKMEGTSPKPKSCLEKMASDSPKQQLSDRSSANRRSQALSNITKCVNLTNLLSAPKTR